MARGPISRFRVPVLLSSLLLLLLLSSLPPVIPAPIDGTCHRPISFSPRSLDLPPYPPACARLKLLSLWKNSPSRFLSLHPLQQPSPWPPSLTATAAVAASGNSGGTVTSAFLSYLSAQDKQPAVIPRQSSAYRVNLQATDVPYSLADGTFPVWAVPAQVIDTEPPWYGGNDSYSNFNYITIPLNYNPLSDSPDHPPNPPFLLAEAAMDHVIVWNYVIDSAETNQITAINLAVLKPGPRLASASDFELRLRSGLATMNGSCVNTFGPIELNGTRVERVAFFGVWEKVKGRMELFVQGSRSVGPLKRQLVTYLKNVWGNPYYDENASCQRYTLVPRTDDMRPRFFHMLSQSFSNTLGFLLGSNLTSSPLWLQQPSSSSSPTPTSSSLHSSSRASPTSLSFKRRPLSSFPIPHFLSSKFQPLLTRRDMFAAAMGYSPSSSSSPSSSHSSSSAATIKGTVVTGLMVNQISNTPPTLTISMPQLNTAIKELNLTGLQLLQRMADYVVPYFSIKEGRLPWRATRKRFFNAFKTDNTKSAFSYSSVTGVLAVNSTQEPEFVFSSAFNFAETSIKNYLGETLFTSAGQAPDATDPHALFDMVHGLRYLSFDVIGNFTIAELFYRSGGIPWKFPANLVNASDISFSFFPNPGYLLPNGTLLSPRLAFSFSAFMPALNVFPPTPAIVDLISYSTHTLSFPGLIRPFSLLPALSISNLLLNFDANESRMYTNDPVKAVLGSVPLDCNFQLSSSSLALSATLTADSASASFLSSLLPSSSDPLLSFVLPFTLRNVYISINASSATSPPAYYLSARLDCTQANSANKNLAQALSFLSIDPLNLALSLSIDGKLSIFFADTWPSPFPSPLTAAASALYSLSVPSPSSPSPLLGFQVTTSFPLPASSSSPPQLFISASLDLASSSSLFSASLTCLGPFSLSAYPFLSFPHMTGSMAFDAEADRITSFALNSVDPIFNLDASSSLSLVQSGVSYVPLLTVSFDSLDMMRLLSSLSLSYLSLGNLTLTLSPASLYVTPSALPSHSPPLSSGLTVSASTTILSSLPCSTTFQLAPNPSSLSATFSVSSYSLLFPLQSSFRSSLSLRLSTFLQHCQQVAAGASAELQAAQASLTAATNTFTPIDTSYRQQLVQKNSTIETAASLLPAAQSAYDASLVPLRAAIANAQSNANVAYNNWQAAEADRAAYHDSLMSNFNDKLNIFIALVRKTYKEYNEELAKYEGVDEAEFYTSVGLRTASVALRFLGPLSYAFDFITTIADAIRQAPLRAAQAKVDALWDGSTQEWKDLKAAFLNYIHNYRSRDGIVSNAAGALNNANNLLAAANTNLRNAPSNPAGVALSNAIAALAQAEEDKRSFLAGAVAQQWQAAGAAVAAAQQRVYVAQNASSLASTELSQGTTTVNSLLLQLSSSPSSTSFSSLSPTLSASASSASVSASASMILFSTSSQPSLSDITKPQSLQQLNDVLVALASVSLRSSYSIFQMAGL